LPPEGGNLLFREAEIPAPGALHQRPEKAVPVGLFNLGVGCSPKNDCVHVEEPGLGIFPERSGQEDVAGIHIGMKDSLAGAELKQPADGSKNPGTGRGLGAGGEKGGQVTALGEIGGDDIDPPEGTDGIKKRGLNLGSGDFSFRKEGGTLDFTSGAVRLQIQVACELAVKTSMHTGTHDDPAGTGDRQKNYRCASGKKTMFRMAAGGVTKGYLRIQFLPCGQDGLPECGADPGGSGGKGAELESPGRRGVRTHGW